LPRGFVHAESQSAQRKSFAENEGFFEMAPKNLNKRKRRQRRGKGILENLTGTTTDPGHWSRAAPAFISTFSISAFPISRTRRAHAFCVIPRIPGLPLDCPALEHGFRRFRGEPAAPG